MILFNNHSLKSKHTKTICCHVVATICPQAAEPKRVRLTVGGDRVDYKGDLATPTANLTAAKYHLSSTISTPGAKYATAGIQYVYLVTVM